MPKPKLTPEIERQADAIVAPFNAEQLRGKPWAHYVTNYRGSYLHLGHQRGGRFWPICRLTYTGDMNRWEFAIYKYSDKHYDPDERLFTGAEEWTARSKALCAPGCARIRRERGVEKKRLPCPNPIQRDPASTLFSFYEGV